MSRPSTFPAISQSVLAAVLETDSGKTGAIMCGISHGTFVKFVNRLGFRRMYVTADERAAVMRSRGISKERAA